MRTFNKQPSPLTLLLLASLGVQGILGIEEASGARPPAGVVLSGAGDAGAAPDASAGYTMRRNLPKSLHTSAHLLEDMIVPTFSLSELQLGTRDRDLLDVLTTTGLLAIRVPAASITNAPNANIASSSSTVSSSFFTELCQCSDKIGPQIQGGEQILLSDGVTTRSTIATATKGSHHPLPLPKEDINDICGPETLSSLERAREYVSHSASGAFIPALDRLIRNGSSSSAGATTTAQHSSSAAILLSTKTASSGHHAYYSVSSIVDDSLNLEHFHVYSKKEQEERDDQGHVLDASSSADAVVDHALDWHTDGGLFLAFLPAQSCNQDTSTGSVEQDGSFRIKMFHDPSSNHSKSSLFTEVKAVFPQEQDGEVIVAIMLGEGAEKWLNTPESLKLRGTRHAVKMRSGESRAWYGMMHLVPPDAIVLKSSGTTFSQLRKTSKAHLLVQDADYVAASSMLDASQGMPTSQERNLVAHVGGPDDCNNLDSFYCWMICQEIPDDGYSFQENMDLGKSLYCLDPATLNRTNDLGQAVAACSNATTGVVGSIMKKTCGNYWYDTDENVQTYTSLYTGTTNNTVDGTGPNDTESSAGFAVTIAIVPYALAIVSLILSLLSM